MSVLVIRQTFLVLLLISRENLNLAGEDLPDCLAYVWPIICRSFSENWVWEKQKVVRETWETVSSQEVRLDETLGAENRNAETGCTDLGLWAPAWWGKHCEIDNVQSWLWRSWTAGKGMRKQMERAWGRVWLNHGVGNWWTGLEYCYWRCWITLCWQDHGNQEQDFLGVKTESWRVELKFEHCQEVWRMRNYSQGGQQQLQCRGWSVKILLQKSGLGAVPVCLVVQSSAFCFVTWESCHAKQLSSLLAGQLFARMPLTYLVVIIK